MSPNSLDTLAGPLAHLSVALTLAIEIDIASVTLATADANVPGSDFLAEPS